MNSHSDWYSRPGHLARTWKSEPKGHLAFSLFLGLALIFFTSGCSSTGSGGNLADEDSVELSTPQSDSQSGAKPMSSVKGRIDPPPGAVRSSPQDEAELDKLLGQIPESARNSSSEVIMPVDPYLVPGSRLEPSPLEKRRQEFKVRQTDKEIVGAAGAIDDRKSQEIGEIDRQLGVVPQDDGGKAPSYLLGVQAIKVLFQEKRYEEALLQTNDLLRFYPRSAQLLTMKGTLHQRLGHIDLALAAYLRAFEYEPSKRLKAQILYLQRLIGERESLKRPREGIVTPGGVQELKSLPPESPQEE